VFEYSAVLVKPEEKCFCLNQKKCLKQGALDLTNCSGQFFYIIYYKFINIKSIKEFTIKVLKTFKTPERNNFHLK